MSRKGVVQGQRVDESKLVRAKEMRRLPTPAESKLWELLKGHRIGFHFRRQQLIQGFIADFYCNPVSLVVEVDGPVHELRKETDERKTKVFEAMGLKVLRFTNEAVLQEPARVFAAIRRACVERAATAQHSADRIDHK